LIQKWLYNGVTGTDCFLYISTTIYSIDRDDWSERIISVKILVISDIHANIYALEAVYNKEKDADAIWCAGDLVDYGTHPEEVIEWMQDHNVLAVQGNHDLHTTKVYRSKTWYYVQPTCYQWVHYCCERLTEKSIAYLENLPARLTLEADGVLYLMQHAYKNYDMMHSLYQFEELWKSAVMHIHPSSRRMIFGHTHRRGIYALDEGTFWINPGSISYRRPDDSDKTAHYCVIKDGVPHLGRVSYDRKQMFAITQHLCQKNAMMETELQDAYFFFGDAPSTRSPLPAADL
jgi:putative phosphoesterase